MESSGDENQPMSKCPNNLFKKLAINSLFCCKLQVVVVTYDLNFIFSNYFSICCFQDASWSV